MVEMFQPLPTIRENSRETEQECILQLCRHFCMSGSILDVRKAMKHISLSPYYSFSTARLFFCRPNYRNEALLPNNIHNDGQRIFTVGCIGVQSYRSNLNKRVYNTRIKKIT